MSLTPQRKPIHPSARELFPYLRRRLLDSRPLLGYRVSVADTMAPGTPIFGKPTFRNVLNERGEHV